MSDDVTKKIEDTFEKIVNLIELLNARLDLHQQSIQKLTKAMVLLREMVKEKGDAKPNETGSQETGDNPR